MHEHIYIWITWILTSAWKTTILDCPINYLHTALGSSVYFLRVDRDSFTYSSTSSKALTLPHLLFVF